MKVVVFGANGFIGAAVAETLAESHDVVTCGRDAESNDYVTDLENQAEIEAVFSEAQPDWVISCAGVVENSEKAELNVVFSENIIRALVKLGMKETKVIISGSAAEYGVVDSLPVSEDSKLHSTNHYGRSKIKETTNALRLAKDSGVDLYVLRLFNPIGRGMKPRFLIPNIIKQVEEIKNGHRKEVEVSRRDAKRDYIDVRDIAHAFEAVINQKRLSHNVYNIGSGKATTNEELIQLILEKLNTPANTPIVETGDKPEPQYASEADISRATQDLRWTPKYNAERTVTEVINA